MHEDLKKICDMLQKELHKTLEKFEKTGEMSGGAVEYMDMLLHALKSVKTIIAMEDSYSHSDGYSNGYSRRYSRDYSGNYSRNYSRASEEVARVKEMIDDIPDEKLRMEMERTLARVANS